MNTNVARGKKLTRVMNSQAAGTTTINGTGVDMQGFDTVVFTALIGALTATQVTSLKVQGSADNSTNWTDLAGTGSGNLADANSNVAIEVEVVKCSAFRYLRPVVIRGTANAVIDGVIAQQFNTVKLPATNDATTVFGSKTVISPAAGAP